jgi:thiamine biosynthesis lipoprotein
MTETAETFECFGSTCTVIVAGDDGEIAAKQAVARAKLLLLDWHRRFSRFEPDSELSRLNADPRQTVPVSEMMARLADAATAAGALTGGLVDATLVDEIERAGYAAHFEASGMSLEDSLGDAPPRRPATARAEGGWRRISVDHSAGTITRPPGVKLDSGGIAKGLFADVLAEQLAEHRAFAVDCGGDIRIGGTGRVGREVRVSSPFDESILHAFDVFDGAVATSGIGRRSWIATSGEPAHHLLDPATGRPAYTGIVQVTALAPSAVLAEALTKATILAGPDAVERWLGRGGVAVYDDGSHRVLPPS